MTERKHQQELTERNIELSAEFSRYLFEHPELEEQIPVEAEIILLPAYDDELKEYNRHLGKQMEAAGEKVVYVTITGLRPKSLSRIERVQLESAVD